MTRWLPVLALSATLAHAAAAQVRIDHARSGIALQSTLDFGGVPERIKLLVYLTAFIPLDGESVNMITSLPEWPPETGARAFALSADRMTVSVAPEAVRERFYHDCSDEDVAHAVARLRPQPFVIRDTPIRTTPERFGSVPRAYIHCADDRSFIPSVQRLMVERSPCVKVASLPTGHSAFLAAPKDLAGILSDFAHD